MNILIVNAFDVYSGAERCVQNIHTSYRQLGHESWIAAGFKRFDDKHTVEIPNDTYRSSKAQKWLKIESFLRRQHFLWRLSPTARTLGQPERSRQIAAGQEDFDFPATWDIPNLIPVKPDIVHLHVLQGGYFDLRYLPELTKSFPTVVTMHDCYLFTGHCAYSLNCDRWRYGCGECPDLGLPPSIPKDGTAFNFQRKNQIFQKSQLHICTPSAWLLNRTEDSILAQSAISKNVIPYGINFDVFHKTDKTEARRELCLPLDRKILLFSGTNVSLNPYKDVTTIRNSIEMLAEMEPDQNPICLLLGEKKAKDSIASMQLESVPFQKDPKRVALYYSAADVYLHAAHRDNLPLAILEASACGTPVIATGVGGIPEEIKSLSCPGVEWDKECFDESKATGILVSKSNPIEMAAAIHHLLKNPDLIEQLGKNAIEHVRSRFTTESEVTSYLNLYEQMIDDFQSENSITS